ncbi:MAG: hypothetical protein JSU87_12140 [Gemmatimonadota bacterium]|nr:MAG: hypothetical protein JSU87_12140 [Gemmatimonadota bacterium]
MIRTAFFRRYLLPGFVFQSVVIAGGYGTGRELAEFFLTYGPLGGILAMLLVSTVIWSAVCAASYEFARVFRSYDYRSFFTHLMGRGWFLYEVGYFALLAIILAVIAAAAGSILQETFALPYAAGVLGIMTAVGFLVFRGSTTIARVLATWSFVLYAVYIILVIWSVAEFGPEIRAAFAGGEAGAGWLVGGVRYAAYNLAIIPAVFFALRDVETRRQAIGAGLLTGPIGIMPAALFFIAMSAHYPAILERPVPANFILEALGSRALQLAYQVVLFGTLIETGTALIHAVNERIAAAYLIRGRVMPNFFRPISAVILLVAGALLSGFGLIELIARGYGTLTWFFLVIFVIPILTWGIFLIRAASKGAAEMAIAAGPTA